MHFAVAIEKAAAAGVEGLVVFHDDDGFFDRIERRTAALEHAPARSHGIAHAVEMGFDHVVRNGPGAAMNYQNRIVQEESSGRMSTIRIAGACRAKNRVGRVSDPSDAERSSAMSVKHPESPQTVSARLCIECAVEQLPSCARSDESETRPHRSAYAACPALSGNASAPSVRV